MIMQTLYKIFENGPAYVAYLTAGDGGLNRTLEAMCALCDGGVNIIELGVPFSDPTADGPVIQQASSRALSAGTTIFDVLELAKQFKQKRSIPIVLFSYYNPVLSAMEHDFFVKAKEAGIDGILIVDLPIEESESYREQCLQVGIAPIFILTPASSEERIKMITEKAEGFIYYACRKGTTGIRSDLPADFNQKISTIKKMTTKPIVVGFGISNSQQAKEVLSYVQGFVVGSYFVKASAEGKSVDELKVLAKNIHPRM